MADIKFTSHKGEVEGELKSAIKQALISIGFTAETHAKKYCPVDTGRLRNSISHTDDGEAAYIGTNVEYGPFIEFGTSKMRAQPYLEPAVTRHKDEYKEITYNALKGK